MRSMGGNTAGIGNDSGYSWTSGNGYGPGIGPQGGDSGFGDVDPYGKNWKDPVWVQGSTGFIGGSGQPGDPFSGTGFNPASQQFQPGHRYSDINDDFWYRRLQWQQQRQDPRYREWQARIKREQMLYGLLRALGIDTSMFPTGQMGGLDRNRLGGGRPFIETQYDDIVNSLPGQGQLRPNSFQGYRLPNYNGLPNYW